MRSASSCALALVVRLNSTLPVVALATMTTNTRTARSRGSWRTVDAFLRAGAAASVGATRANSSPSAIDTTPGTATAARQPKCCTRKPVVSAAAAMPRLPTSPLMPMARPGVAECCTSIGMPTGW